VFVDNAANIKQPSSTVRTRGTRALCRRIVVDQSAASR
jgi:hypothetical protein